MQGILPDDSGEPNEADMDDTSDREQEVQRCPWAVRVVLLAVECGHNDSLECANSFLWDDSGHPACGGAFWMGEVLGQRLRASLPQLLLAQLRLHVGPQASSPGTRPLASCPMQRRSPEFLPTIFLTELPCRFCAVLEAPSRHVPALPAGRAGKASNKSAPARHVYRVSGAWSPPHHAVPRPMPVLHLQEEVKPPSERLLAWLAETAKYMQAKAQGKGRLYYGHPTPADGDY